MQKDFFFHPRGPGNFSIQWNSGTLFVKLEPCASDPCETVLGEDNGKFDRDSPVGICGGEHFRAGKKSWQVAQHDYFGILSNFGEFFLKNSTDKGGRRENLCGQTFDFVQNQREYYVSSTWRKFLELKEGSLASLVDAVGLF